MEKYVEFKIDPKEEAKNLPKLIKLLGKRALINLLKEKHPKITEEELLSEIRRLHREHKNKFKKVKKIYEKIWKKIGDKYIAEIEKLLEFKIKDKKTCYITISLWVNVAEVLGRKNLFIVCAETQQVPLDYLLLHELTHLYYSDTLVSLNLREAYESPLMEGVDRLILHKSPIQKLFSGITYDQENFVKNNPKFMKELEKAWLKRKSFESFLKQSIKINKKHKNIKIQT